MFKEVAGINSVGKHLRIQGHSSSFISKIQPQQVVEMGEHDPWYPPDTVNHIKTFFLTDRNSCTERRDDKAAGGRTWAAGGAGVRHPSVIAVKCCSPLSCSSLGAEKESPTVMCPHSSSALIHQHRPVAMRRRRLHALRIASPGAMRSPRPLGSPTRPRPSPQPSPSFAPPCVSRRDASRHAMRPSRLRPPRRVPLPGRKGRHRLTRI